MKKRKVIIKSIIISMFVILVALFGAFYIYVSDYYHADKSAISSVLNSKNIVRDGRVTHLTATPESNVGFIFYPGGKVEADAYLPLLNLIRNKGLTTFLVRMPYNLAVFDSNAASRIIDDHPEITVWYIGGHSLGGAMASNYFASHTNEIDGLILLGSYTYGDVPSDRTIIIYGSKDTILDTDKISDEDRVYIIEGGNHAQFGNYGPQKGDGVPEMTPIEQQVITTNIIYNFIKE